MKKDQKKQQTIFAGAVIAIFIVAGLYFLAASNMLQGGDITGAVVGPSGACDTPQSYIAACKEFKAGNWEFKPAELDQMSAAAAKANCEKWLAGKC